MNTSNTTNTKTLVHDQETIKEAFRELKRQSDGPQMLELLNVCFKTRPGEYFFKEPVQSYAQMEHEWYISESLNVHDMSEPPTIWKNISDFYGFINSNYGYLAFSKENGSQFQNVVHKLKKDKDSRQGTLVYTRPSIHTDAVKDGMSDFICTTHQQLRIVNNKLELLSSMRSNDAIFGFSYDVQWARYIQSRAYETLKETYPSLELGDVTWFASTLHIYERHYDLVK